MDSKSPDAFRTISEVADDLDLPQHVLRFWETRFSQIKPMKRGGGRRYYRPDDVDLLRGIRHLLYGEGYTIKGVQRILREQGVRYVMTVADPQAAGAEDYAEPAHDASSHAKSSHAKSSHAGAEPARQAGKAQGGGRLSQAMHAVGDDADVATTPPHADEGASRDAGKAARSHDPAPRAFDENDRYEAFLPDRVVRTPHASQASDRPQKNEATETSIEERPVRRKTARKAPDSGAPDRGAPIEEAPVPETAQDEPLPRDVRPDDEPIADKDYGSRRGFRLMDRLRGDRGSDEGQAALSRDEIRRLQATLFELLECKRLLDQAR